MILKFVGATLPPSMKYATYAISYGIFCDGALWLSDLDIWYFYLKL